MSLRTTTSALTSAFTSAFTSVFTSAFTSLFLLAAFPLLATTWNVGPTRTYTTPSAVVGLVKEGDTVMIDSGVYRDLHCEWLPGSLTFIGKGTVVLLPETTQVAASTWTLAGNNSTVRNIEFRDGVERSEGGVGLLVTGHGCTVDSCVFARNRGGVKFAQDGPSSPLVYASLFEENEELDVEAAAVQYLTVLRCWFRGSANAVNIRSSASFHNITLNLFTDERGASTTTIHLQHGGYTQMYGNIFHGARMGEPRKHFVRYVADVPPYPDWTHHLECAWNTFVNDVDSIAFIESTGTRSATLEIKNCLFAGKGTQIQDTTDSGRVTIDTAGNFADSTVDSVGFVDPSVQNYHLTAWSPVRDHWQSPRIQQIPVEYKHPRQERPRPGGCINVGAFDYEEPPPTPRTWHVGWGRTHGTPSDVCRRVHDGDTVLIDSGEYVDGISQWSTNNLTIIGLGKVVIRSNGSTSFRSALWEIVSGSVSINGIEFRDHTTIEGNGTGIYITGGRVSLRSCAFTRLQRSIVYAPYGLDAQLDIQHCSFVGGGSENIYPMIQSGSIRSLDITGSSFQNVGAVPILRSEAWYTTIVACSIDAADTSMRTVIDVPSGSFLQLWGTNIHVNSGGSDREILRYIVGSPAGAPSHGLYVGFNTVVNDGVASAFVNATTDATMGVRIINNLLVGSGLGSTVTTSDPSAIANNLHVFDAAQAGLMDASTMNYRLTDLSPARLAAIPAGNITITDRNDSVVTYPFQPPVSYVQGQGTEQRTSWFDIGAYESLRTADVPPVHSDVASLLIAPNPAASSITLSLPPSLIGTDVIIMDLQGSEVARFTATHTTQHVNIASLVAGVYVVQSGTYSTLFSVLP
jgi:hypothetical protein